MNVVRSTSPGIVALSRLDDRFALRTGMAAIHELEQAVVDVLKRHVEIGNDLASMAQHSIKLVAEELGIAVKDADPFDAVDLFEGLEQLGQPGPAIEVDPVVGHVLRDQDQLADAVAGQFLGLGDDHLDRLGHMLAAHVRDRAKRAEPVAAFRNLKIGKMSGRDPHPRPVFLSQDRGWPEQGPLFRKPAEQPVGHAGDLLPAEHTDHVVDLGKLLDQRLFRPLGQAPGDDQPLDLARALALEHFLDDADRLPPRYVDEATGVDNHQIGPLRIGYDQVTILSQ